MRLIIVSFIRFILPINLMTVRHLDFFNERKDINITRSIDILYQPPDGEKSN